MRPDDETPWGRYCRYLNEVNRRWTGCRGGRTSSYIELIVLVSGKPAAVDDETGTGGLDHFITSLEGQAHLVASTGVKGMPAGEAATDFTVAWLIRLAVEGALRFRSVVPVPLGADAVEVFVVIGTALQAPGERDLRWRKGKIGSGAQGQLRAVVLSVSLRGEPDDRDQQRVC